MNELDLPGVSVVKLTGKNNFAVKKLLAAAGSSQSSLSKMRRNGNVNMDILVKVCTALNCDIGDIMEIVKKNEELSQ